MAFLRKSESIMALKPDVLVIQEISQRDIAAINPPFSYWVGNYVHKGSAVLGFGDHEYSIDPSYTDAIPWYIPLRINDVPLNILAVWAYWVSRSRRYVRLTHEAVTHYQKFLSVGHTIIAGDFNSNSVWDAEHGELSHSNLNKKFEILGIESAYHYHKKELHGKELTPTQYQYRHVHEGYHLDYMYVSKELLPASTFSVLDMSIYLKMSDHMPLVLDINL
jgi:hypothetical protein